MVNEKSFFTVDQVARFVVSEDSTVRIIDLRTPEEFRKKNIPGSVNIPYIHFLDTDPQNYFTTGNIKTIFYSNGDFDCQLCFTQLPKDSNTIMSM